MTLIVQIVLGLSVLVGLVTIIMSSKNWHWTQLVLVLFIFFSAIGFLFLGAETVRIHQNLRKAIPANEQKLARWQQQNDELLNGAGEKPGILKLEHRLKIVTRERGRVWRGVMPAGQVDQQGRVSVEITKPKPHGLEKDAILYAFEEGNANAANPAEGKQYLGEFRVAEVQEGGAVLDPVLLIDNRTGERLAKSEGPWSLYETMPIDRHRLFAGFPEEALRAMLPAESVEEYLRHGSEATSDDDEWHVTGLDQDGKRVGPDNIDQAVRRLYDRSLRDYAYIFSELAGEKVVTLAKQEAVAKDNALLVKALAGAEETGKFRQQQIAALNADLAGMKQDRAAIQSHRDAVLGLLSHFQERIESYRQANSDFVRQFTERQLSLTSYINRVAPAPSR
ncbi:MAG: hypothetical protein GXP24_08940 [Planctomycetes bacterium]|nr:hypothetical protein [Planctomycetota bacterium]